jgi:PAS domain S-box-containing protein
MKDASNELLVRMQAIINTAIDGIITINTRGVIENINPAGAHMFGYESEELVGQSINNLMPKPDSVKHDGYLMSYLKTGHAKIIGIGREVHGLRKDGSRFPFRLAVSEVKLKDRVIFTGVVHDLSEVKKAQEEVERLNKELEIKVQERTNELEKVVNQLLKINIELEQRKDQLKDALNKEIEVGELKSRFVSMASHEFRTPLSTVLSSASIITRYVREDQQEDRTRHVGKIKAAVDNLTGILDDFLSLSKLEEGKQSINTQTVNLREVCIEVKEDISGLITDGKKINIVAESFEIRSDERILRNIFFNLLSNALKYSLPETTVYCFIKKNGKKVRIEVRDEGIGIPLEDQKHIFTRFFRATNAENIQGTGLGLNIVRGYIDLLKGDINFESIPGEGTTFVINLPIDVEENTGH